MDVLTNHGLPRDVEIRGVMWRLMSRLVGGELVRDTPSGKLIGSRTYYLACRVSELPASTASVLLIEESL